eukprot:9144874-Karenia_brevis.AAC.1
MSSIQATILAAQRKVNAQLPISEQLHAVTLGITRRQEKLAKLGQHLQDVLSAIDSQKSKLAE